jgi:hypothetical protein
VTRALDWLAGLEGWRWVLAWVVATILPGFVLQPAVWLVNYWLAELGSQQAAGGRSEVVTTLLPVGGLTFAGSAAIAAMQSVILRRFAVPSGWWIVGSAFAATVVALIGVGVVRFSASRPGSNFADLDARVQAAAWISAVLGSLVVGAVQARVMSRAIAGAWLWIPTVLVASVSHRLLLGIVVEPGSRPPAFILYGGLAPVYALVLGVGMWWLLSRGRARRPAVAGVTP